MSHNSEMTCPECGGLQTDGMTCWEQLGVILAWEYNDPTLQAQHFLTVAGYNLQHPAQFTAAAITGLRAAFIDHLDNGLPIAQILERARAAYDGSQRVKKPEAERQPILRAWRVTVADVYHHGQPTGAAERVRSWAASIREDMR